MMKALFTSLLIICCSVTANAQANYTRITNYEVYIGCAEHYPQDWMILRRFENNGKPYLLMVNPQTLNFIQLLRSKASSIAKKQWLLYDLRETVEEEAEVK